MLEPNTVPLTEECVEDYLDHCIRYWRQRRDAGDPIAVYYVDCFQSVRSSLLGGRLPEGAAAADDDPGESEDPDANGGG